MNNKTKLIGGSTILILISVFLSIWCVAKFKGEGLNESSVEEANQGARPYSGSSSLSSSDTSSVRGSGRAGESEPESAEKRVKSLLKEFSSLAGNDAGTSALLSSLLSEDEQLAHQVIADMTDGDLNVALLREVFLGFYKNQDRILDALAAFDTVGKNNDFGSYLIEELLQLAGEKDLNKTYEWAMANPKNIHLANGLAALGAHFAKTANPEEKVDEIISSEMDVYARGAFLTGLLADWSEKDNDAAFGYFSTLDQSAALDWSIHRSVDALAKLDLEEALEWAAYITDSDLRELTEREVRLMFETDDPNNAE